MGCSFPADLADRCVSSCPPSPPSPLRRRIQVNLMGPGSRAFVGALLAAPSPSTRRPEAATNVVTTWEQRGLGPGRGKQRPYERTSGGSVRCFVSTGFASAEEPMIDVSEQPLETGASSFDGDLELSDERRAILAPKLDALMAQLRQIEELERLELEPAPTTPERWDTDGNR